MESIETEEVQTIKSKVALKEKIVTDYYRDFYNTFSSYTDDHLLHPKILNDLQHDRVIPTEFIEYKRPEPELKPKAKVENITVRKDYLHRNENEKQIQKVTDVIVGKAPPIKKAYNATIPSVSAIPIEKRKRTFLYSGGNINKADWIPYIDGDKFKPEKEFVEWINSMYLGFSNAIPYTKFNLYYQQACDWLSEEKIFTDCKTKEEKNDWLKEERRRFKENSTYFVMKYGKMKEAAIAVGYREFKESIYSCQIAINYLIDCGFSAIIAKGRQLGITSDIGAVAACKTIYNASFFVKYVCESDDKVKDIFEDKIKYPVSQLPFYVSSESSGDYQKGLKFGKKSTEKGRDKKIRKILVETPSNTSVNGGSPDIFLVDEAGATPNVIEMVNEARPTLFWVNPNTGKYEIQRQIVMWGTGGEMKSDNFKIFYTAAWDAWKRGDYNWGFVPVFLDCWSREGFTQKEYESQKEYYYNLGKKNQFHSHFPVTVEDVFSANGDETMMSIENINYSVQRINATPATKLPIKGKFEPIYDTNQPMGLDSRYPYKITGAEWVPGDQNDDNSPIQLFRHPVLGWKYRYYQGTDPINHETGRSMFASSIWDEEEGTIACLINFRVPDYNECYLQAYLMQLYYGGVDVPHLIENNIGAVFIEFMEKTQLANTLIHNSQLNPRYHTHGVRVGISCKTHTKAKIIESMQELVDTYSQNIYYHVYFQQLRTFIKKATKEGRSKWQAMDLNRFKDDVLFAVTYSKMAADVYATLNKTPKSPSQQLSRKQRTFLRRGESGLYTETIFS